MSSVFSRKITMSIFSGAFTGDGTFWNQRTGRRHTYRSRIWRSATLRLRMPPPTGVVSGPLMPLRWSRKASTVSSGSQLPVSSKAIWPASTSFQAMRLPCFEAAASKTRTAARQMSGPVPSPSMNGMMGSSGTFSWPSASVILAGIRAPASSGTIFGGRGSSYRRPPERSEATPDADAARLSGTQWDSVGERDDPDRDDEQREERGDRHPQRARRPRDRPAADARQVVVALDAAHAVLGRRR